MDNKTSVSDLDEQGTITADELRVFFKKETLDTIYNWSKWYGDFLSAGANPEKHNRRYYTLQDVEKLAYVDQRTGKEPQEMIYAALERGDIVPVQFSSESELKSHVAKELKRQDEGLQLQISQVNAVNAELMKSNRELEHKIVRLETLIEEKDRQLRELKEQPSDRDKLLRDNAKLEYQLELIKGQLQDTKAQLSERSKVGNSDAQFAEPSEEIADHKDSGRPAAESNHHEQG